jgi:hypothetical protein
MLLVLAVNGWEASFWPRNNYPDALWHRKQPGDWTKAGIDICWPQERLPVTGPGAVGAYWFGENPYGFGGYYRPVTFTLYWLEYRLFGTDDQRWCHVSVGLYLAIQLLLVWLVSVLAPGPFARKLGMGVLAALLMGGPGLADRGIHYWVLDWWPAQPELLPLRDGMAAVEGLVPVLGQRLRRRHHRSGSGCDRGIWRVPSSFQEAPAVAALP